MPGLILRMFYVFIFLSLLFFISAWFYSLRRDSIEILQVDYSNSFTTLHDLLQESQPIILKGCPVPPILTSTKLAEIPRLNAFPLSGSYTLEAYRTSPGSVLPAEQIAGIPLIEPIIGRTLAKELSLDKWMNYNYTDFMVELSGYFSVVKSFRTRVLLGGHGMVRPRSLYTCILVSEGSYVVSLVNKRSEAFLPNEWETRYPSSLTINDTALVGEIQFIDIILRPGTMLIVPCHIIYSMGLKSADTFNSALILELDSPISQLASLILS
jgi:hypothetical protein